MPNIYGIKSIDFLDLTTQEIQFNKHLGYFDKVFYDKTRFRMDLNTSEAIIYSPGDAIIRKKQGDFLNKNLRHLERLENAGLVEGIEYTEFNGGNVPEEEVEKFVESYLIENLPFKMAWSAFDDSVGDEGLESLINDYKFAQYLFDRKMANLLNHDKSTNAVPIISTLFSPNNPPFFDHFQKRNISTQSDVLAFVINEFPVLEMAQLDPDRLIELKANEDLQLRLKGLRNWVNKVSSGKATAVEAEQEFEYLRDSYEEHLQKITKKYTYSGFEVFLTTTLEIIGGLATLQFHKIHEKWFAIKRAKLNMLIEEDKAPGREVSYITQLEKELSYLKPLNEN